MHTSAQWGRLQIMKMLIDDFDDDAEAITTNGRTPLHVAAALGQVR
jgi:ankyrin repeat protein